jgi:hypothetical protein
MPTGAAFLLNPRGKTKGSILGESNDRLLRLDIDLGLSALRLAAANRVEAAAQQGMIDLAERAYRTVGNRLAHANIEGVARSEIEQGLKDLSGQLRAAGRKI